MLVGRSGDNSTKDDSDQYSDYEWFEPMLEKYSTPTFKSSMMKLERTCRQSEHNGGNHNDFSGESCSAQDSHPPYDHTVRKQIYPHRVSIQRRGL